ncbi:hypothetical protein SLI_7854 [Streptomyces lividans 1326]|uniref:Uncharacterized protein n=1 Tax=Streptomyces lividans 1326 TaxID=1200984 RepID=A0A7U9E4B0_STRLI|nr:hypothetical protein SLI_7854 [Streptomyces lividans 1326]
MRLAIGPFLPAVGLPGLPTGYDRCRARKSSPKGIGRAEHRTCSLHPTVTPPEEVRPMNAVSTWVLPLPVMAGD